MRAKYQTLKSKIRKRILTHSDTKTKKTIDAYVEKCAEHVYCQLCNKIKMIENYDLTTDCVVDHFHLDSESKGPIRGLLCKHCNVTEGKIRKLVEDYSISFGELLKMYGNTFLTNLSILYTGSGGIIPMQTDHF